VVLRLPNNRPGRYVAKNAPEKFKPQRRKVSSPQFAGVVARPNKNVFLSRYRPAVHRIV
jgi:hypothetical protein